MTLRGRGYNLLAHRKQVLSRHEQPSMTEKGRYQNPCNLLAAHHRFREDGEDFEDANFMKE